MGGKVQTTISTGGETLTSLLIIETESNYQGISVQTQMMMII